MFIIFFFFYHFTSLLNKSKYITRTSFNQTDKYDKKKKSTICTKTLKKYFEKNFHIFAVQLSMETNIRKEREKEKTHVDDSLSKILEREK